MCVALGEKAGDTVTEKKAHHAELRRFHIGILQMGVQVELSAPAQSILAVENGQSRPASTASSPQSLTVLPNVVFCSVICGGSAAPVTAAVKRRSKILPFHFE